MGRLRNILLYAIVIGFVAISLFMLAVGETLMGAMGLCFFGGLRNCVSGGASCTLGPQGR